MQPTLEQTSEQITKQYSAAMDSVNLINQLRLKENITSDELDVIDRNVEHLKIMLNKDFWTTEDLEPLKQSVE
jgi:hypothetical protein